MGSSIHWQLPLLCSEKGFYCSASSPILPPTRFPCCLPSAAAAAVERISESSTQPPHLDRRSLLLGSVTLAGILALESSNEALADVKVVLSNVRATEVPCPEGQTPVTGGTIFGATCFRVTCDATNPAKQPVYNADIFGRVYDAQGEAALDAVENLRIDTIAEIPPGKSKVSFQITVNEAQAKLGPLELKNFKATGYLGRVNNKQGTGRLSDMDFSELNGEDEVP